MPRSAWVCRQHLQQGCLRDWDASVWLTEEATGGLCCVRLRTEHALLSHNNECKICSNEFQNNDYSFPSWFHHSGNGLLIFKMHNKVPGLNVCSYFIKSKQVDKVITSVTIHDVNNAKVHTGKIFLWITFKM